MFVYKQIFDFPGCNEEIKTFASRNFVDSVLNLIFNDIVIHHSHISGNIIGYVHNFCNQKVKENYKQTISVFAHNLFRFDFFYTKGIEIVCVEN